MQLLREQPLLFGRRAVRRERLRELRSQQGRASRRLDQFAVAVEMGVEQRLESGGGLDRTARRPRSGGRIETHTYRRRMHQQAAHGILLRLHPFEPVSGRDVHDVAAFLDAPREDDVRNAERQRNGNGQTLQNTEQQIGLRNFFEKSHREQPFFAKIGIYAEFFTIFAMRETTLKTHGI